MDQCHYHVRSCLIATKGMLLRERGAIVEQGRGSRVLPGLMMSRVLRRILNRFFFLKSRMHFKDFYIVLKCLHNVWKEKWLRLDLPLGSYESICRPYLGNVV